MLHAYFCSPDKAIKKHRLEVLKSMEIELRGLQNPFEKQLQSDTAPEKAFEPQFFRKIVIFRWFLDSKTKPKSKKKCWKCDAQKQCFFESIFIGWRFGLRKWNEISLFFEFLSEKPILWKSLFFHRKIAIFLVLSFPKSIKFRCQNAFENDIEKKGSKIEFGHRFWFPKTTKIDPQSDVERSLCRDAMQLTRKSSQVNGTRRL